MLRWLISVAAALDAGGTGMDRSVYYGLIPVLSVRIPAALAALVGDDLGDAPEVAESSPGPAAEVIRAFTDDLAEVIGPAIHDPEAQRRTAAAAHLYLPHLMACDTHGSATAADDLDDVAAVLGHRPRDADDAEAQLALLVRSGEATTDLLTYFWRHGRRQVTLWPSVAQLAHKIPTFVPGGCQQAPSTAPTRSEL
jgi:hypothetical protein